MATETAIDVVMPQMGVSVSEGTITKWLKREGDTIEADEPLLEISTDKVDTEVPSPASGVVTQILVQEGETVDVGTKLAQIGGAVAQPAAEAPPAPAPEPAPQAQAVQPPAQPVQPPAVEQPSGNGKAFVSPVVARIASEHGVDPGEVQGTGRGGRVTKQDILNFIDNPPPAAPAAPAHTPPAAPAATAPAAPKIEEAPAIPAPQASPPLPSSRQAQPADIAPGESMESVTAMRRGIAEHMRRSLDTAAHVTSAIEVDLSRVVAARASLKKEYEASYGVNPTYLELQDGKGLIVPVLRNAETMNLLGLAKGIADLAAKARNKKLMPDDVQGGTFTITNPGGYGTFHGTPVINQPQSGILGTYALVKRPVVVQDDRRADVIAIRPMMNITLTYDHRLVDGAYAGRFLRDLRERLQSWEGDGG